MAITYREVKYNIGKCFPGATADMIASTGCLSIPEAASATGAALAGAGAFATSSTSPTFQVAFMNRHFKCVSFMRHSIATSNEAAAASVDAMSSVYLNEAYADSRWGAMWVA